MFYFFKKFLIGWKYNFRNANADPDANADADAELPMPRFPDGAFIHNRKSFFLSYIYILHIYLHINRLFTPVKNDKMS